MSYKNIQKYVLVFLLIIAAFFINIDCVEAKQKNFPGVSDDLINKVVTDRYCKYDTGTVLDLNSVSISDMYSHKTIVLAVSGGELRFLSPTKESLIKANGAWDTDGFNQYVNYDSNSLNDYLMSNGELNCKVLYYTESGDDLYIYTPDQYQNNLNMPEWEREMGQFDVTDGIYGNNGKQESEKACTDDKLTKIEQDFGKIYTNLGSELQNLGNGLKDINNENFQRKLEEAQHEMANIYTNAVNQTKKLGDNVGCIDSKAGNKIESLEKLYDDWISKINKIVEEALEKGVQDGELTEEEKEKLKEEYEKDKDVREDARKKANQAFAKWLNHNNSILTGGKSAEMTCEGILGENVLDDIKTILLWIRIAVPILLIVLGTLDFGKAVLNDDAKALSKATSTFVKRVIAAILVFFAPIIIMLLINTVDKLAGGCDIRGL